MIGHAWQRPSTLPRFDRLRDLVVASALILLVLPLMIFVAIAIKCDSRGPVLNWELRVGLKGHRFWACQYRTTVYRDGARSPGTFTFVGRVIHYLRIDTLPQLVNVLRGDMTWLSDDPQRTFFLE